MSGLETAIRNALSRSDRSDPNVRERIYHSARQALDAGLKKQDITDPVVIANQQSRLEELILQIESEEAEAQAAQADDILVEPPAPAARAQTSVPVDADVQVAGQTRDAPRTEYHSAGTSDLASDLGGMRAEPGRDRLTPPPARDLPPKRAPRGLFRKKQKPEKAAPRTERAPQVPGEKRPRRRRGFISRLFIYVIFFTFLGMGLWWAYTAGLFMSYAERDKSVPNPPASIQEEDYTGAPTTALDPKQGFSSDWLEIYGGGSNAKVSPGAQASADVVAVAGGPALRITSNSPDAAGDVAIEVSPDILRQIAGKTSTIAVTLQASGDEAVQLALRCDFSSLGGCARHRVMAEQERADTLFRVTFDRGLAPTQPGRIFINGDILGGRQPVLIYSIRVLPGQ